jgi:hypothetical protein
MALPIFRKRKPAPDEENGARQNNSYQCEVEQRYVKHINHPQ